MNRIVGTPTTRKVSADPHRSLIEAVTVSRFWRLVDIGDPGECWPWLGSLSKGYGEFFYGERIRPAHELALSFSTGEVRLSNLDTCHSCDNPPCCNPSHLRFDTRQGNVNDMIERGRAVMSGRKLTDEEIITIRERRANGARQKDLASQFGVSDGLISMVVRGLRWPNLPGPIEHKRKANG